MEANHYKLYRVDPEKCSVLINGEETVGEYFMVYQNDKVEVLGTNGHIFNGWNEKVCFDSPIAKCILREAKL